MRIMAEARKRKVQPNQGTGATPVPQQLLRATTLRPPDFRALLASWADPVARRKGLAIYEEMLSDPMVAASLDLLKYAALSLGWSVRPGRDDDPRAGEVAREVEETLRGWPGGWNEFLYNVLSCIEYGYSITEVIWQTDSDRWRPAKWVPLPQPLYGFALDPQTGEVQGVVPLLPPTGRTDPYPLDAFVIARWAPRFGAPYGRSQLLRAYEAWWMKQLLRRMRNTTLDRYGSPLLAVRVPPNTPEDDRKKLKDFLENLYAEAGIVINSNVEILPVHQGAGGGSAEAYQRAIEYEDAQIAKAIMGTVLNANESRGAGTYAQARVHQDNFLYWVRRATQLLADVVNGQIIKRYVLYNFGEGVPTPQLVYEPPEKEDLAQMASIIQTAYALQVIAPQAEADWIRARLGLPPASPEVKAILEGAQQAQGQAGLQYPDYLTALFGGGVDSEEEDGYAGETR